MCSKEDVQKIVGESECRIEKAHMSVAKSISDWGDEVKRDKEQNAKEHLELGKRLDSIETKIDNLIENLDVDGIKDLLQKLSSVATVGGMVKSLASVAGAVLVVVGFFVWIVKNAGA